VFTWRAILTVLAMTGVLWASPRPAVAGYNLVEAAVDDRERGSLGLLVEPLLLGASLGWLRVGG
jgi:hypothetical protein